MVSSHYGRWLRAVHTGMMGGLLYLSVCGLMMFYTFSPSWLHHAEASGYSLFSGSSFWNTAIPRYTDLNTSSSVIAQDIVDQVAQYSANFDTSDKSSPVYVVESDESTQVVIPWDCTGGGADTSLTADWQAVPIPYYAQPGDGPTHPMIIYQPSTATVWEFDEMQNLAGQWQACHGGRIDNVFGADGIFTGSKGVTDSGLALVGGQVSLAELKNGVIGHAIGLSLPQTAGRTWPANRSIASNGIVAAGTRLQLDPSLDVSSLGLSRTATLIAKTAQKYGFVVWDSGSTVGIIGENPKSATVRGLANPYGTLGGTSLAGFPWDKLRALPANFGQSNLSPVIDSFTVSSARVISDEPVDFAWSSNNIDECAIPGVASHLAATGNYSGLRVKDTSVYTLSCSGPAGSVSRQVNVSATPITVNDPVPVTTAVSIAQPVGGNRFIVPGLDDPDRAARVYKVAFYQQEKLLDSTTTPPYQLDTTTLADGSHQLGARIYFRDGHLEMQNLKIKVQNQPEQLLLPTNFASVSQQQVISPTIYVLGTVGAFVTTFLSGVYGWRLTHPARALKKQAKKPYI